MHCTGIESTYLMRSFPLFLPLDLAFCPIYCVFFKSRSEYRTTYFVSVFSSVVILTECPKNASTFVFKHCYKTRHAIIFS